MIAGRSLDNICCFIYTGAGREERWAGDLVRSAWLGPLMRLALAPSLVKISRGTGSLRRWPPWREAHPWPWPRCKRPSPSRPTSGRRANAESLYRDDGATLDDIREAVTTLAETERTARRVLGGAHPITRGIEVALRDVRAALHARETPSGSA